MLEGHNICVLDLETARSADDCKVCGQSNEQCVRGYPIVADTHVFTKIGWENTTALGLSIGCFYSYVDNQCYWFDRHTLETTVRSFIKTQPLLVSFNGRALDFPLMEGLLRQQADLWFATEPECEEGARLIRDCNRFAALCSTSYDILQAIWQADPARKFERGLNSLGAISEANGLGKKEMDGATAPRLWAQGRYAEVLNYCQGDVLKTKALFENICQTGGRLLRGDKSLLTIRMPDVMAGP